ncbi:MAG: hypothetical protein OEX02_21205, partial [Cyclobacteriaceae bacterium]|nr:hypothetical protein [Cyclobacteriaceae bacterium]
VSYIRKDTLCTDGTTQAIYVYSPGEGAGQLQLQFTETTNGDYVRDNSHINGMVYRWVEPVNGVGQGQYSPERKVLPPVRRKMVSSGASYMLTGHERIFTEVGFSGFDQNSLSPLDDDDNTGFAIKAGMKSSGRKMKWLPSHTYGWFTDFEFNDQHFKTLDPIRSVEFDREWGITNSELLSGHNENILNSGFSLGDEKNNRINYSGQWRQRGNVVNGYMHHMLVEQRLETVKVFADLYDMSGESNGFHARWKKILLDVKNEGRYFQPGYAYAYDKNQSYSLSNDSLMTAAQNYDEHKVYVQNGSTARNNFNVYYSYRRDYKPYGGEEEREDLARTIGALFDLNGRERNLKGRVAWRDVQSRNRDDMRVFMGMLEGKSHWLDKSVYTQFNIDTRGGWEPVRDYIYVEVPVGQGYYTWRDMNANGTQELDEFFEALNFDEMRYVRVFVFSQEKRPVQETTINSRIHLRAPDRWTEGGGLKKLATHFEATGRLSSGGKMTVENLSKRFSMLTPGAGLDQVLSGKQNIRGRAYFNRGKEDFSMDVGAFRTAMKNGLMGGFEGYRAAEDDVNVYLRLFRNMGWSMQASKAEKHTSSDVFAGRNYHTEKESLSGLLKWSMPAGRGLEG